MADHFSNAGIILGSGRPLTAADDLAALNVVLECEGIEIGASRSGSSLDAILESLSWLARYAASLGAPLCAGTAIITGARIGPLVVRNAGEYVGSCSLGEVLMIVLAPDRVRCS
jgi:2-keto-4-pentenoate hydratase